MAIESEQREQSIKTERQQLPAFSIFFVLRLLLLVVIGLAVSFGSTSIPLDIIAQILLNGTHIFHFKQTWDATTAVIVWQIRMPMVIAAALVGAALAVAGVLFQGMLRNPLADPFLIGTSSGAALGATVAFVLPYATFYGAYFPITPLFAFVGAMITVLFVYAIARSDGRTPVVTLLLAGVVVNAVLVALQTLILTLSPRSPFNVQALFNWLSGGVTVTSWPPVIVIAIIVIASSIYAFTFTSTLDVLALGEESAAHLGVHVESQICDRDHWLALDGVRRLH